jgi:hypothetical protein
MLYARDASWWIHHSQEALKFPGLKVSSDAGVPYPAVLGLRESGKTGFDDDPGALRHGNNSGYQALHIAAQAGAARVLLVGFDMHGTHFFGPHPSPLRNTKPETFAEMIRNFATIAPELDARGVSVINCTPGSALDVFPKMSLEAALSR